MNVSGSREHLYEFFIHMLYFPCEKLSNLKPDVATPAFQTYGKHE